jgi:hypothetical protein
MAVECWEEGGKVSEEGWYVKATVMNMSMALSASAPLLPGSGFICRRRRRI